MTREEKLGIVRRAFAPLVGATLTGCSTAEVLRDDGTWSPWPDLPIRLEWDSRRTTAVSWSRFDDLWISSEKV